MTELNDETLKEFYERVKSTLLANGFTPGSCRRIDFGLQFTVSREGKIGLLRIYRNLRGTIRIDPSQLKDADLIRDIRQILDAGPAATLPVTEPPAVSGKKSGDPYNPGYPIIGTDESGKGDYFGPLVVAAVYIDEQSAAELRTIGVRDSKTCTNTEIRLLAEEIKHLCAGRFAIVEFSPEDYNQLYEQLRSEGKNLNTMLAWGHAKAIEELLGKVDCHFALCDKFGDERLIRGKLRKKGKTLRLIQLPRAEQNIAVAAASILARARFLEKMEAMSERCGMMFPRGASTGVLVAVKQFVARSGPHDLFFVAKLHFRTTEDVLGDGR
ncbi:MAG: Ribonuclease HIII [Methanoregula sp. SKADARSKE-2]|nr:MAG: Ribonuclease HIII [Methanoregula sp. SKADARSKE-2]